MIYYNEFDPFAAAWLEKLMDHGVIPKGYIDTRSITEVKADEIRGYTQCHFFAGIGGWSEALRLAGWETSRPVWTGSCPCQPFSSAGNQKGKSDERHLWPVWFNLIRECRPAAIFGEQVSSAISHGWLDDVYQGLEAEGYACGSAVLPACSVGAPHKRDRLWFVANASNNGCDQGRERIAPSGRNGVVGNGGAVADAIDTRLQGHSWNEQDRHEPGRLDAQSPGSAWAGGIWIECPDGKQRLVEPSIRLLAHGVQNRVGKLRGYGNAIVPQVAAEFIGAFMDTQEKTK